MKKTLIRLLPLFILFIALSGCQSAADAEKFANLFHEQIKSSNVDGMLNCVHEDGFGFTPKEDWRELFANVIAFGELDNAEKSPGFHTEIKNGVTQVELNYVLNFKNGKQLSENMTWQNSGNGYKIVAYRVQE